MLLNNKKNLRTIYKENTIIGVIILAIIAFFLQLLPLGDKFDGFKNSVVYIFIIVILLEVYFIRLETDKVKDLISEVSKANNLIIRLNNSITESYEDVNIVRSIRHNSLIDKEFDNRYQSLVRQIRELSLGRYSIESLDGVYKNDINSISELRKNEELFSTCVVAPIPNKAIEQIEDQDYKNSIQEHKLAVQRGVNVTRIYLFRDEESLQVTQIQEHLVSLQNAGIKVLILFRNLHRVIPEIDYLVFGNRKVSIGSINPDNPTACVAAVIDVNPNKVDEYRQKYIDLMNKTLSLNDALNLK